MVKTYPIRKYTTVWLYIVGAMVMAMIAIGGVTRLTDSGLSIVDWRPLMGVFPPTSDIEWMEKFNQYKAFPEYKLVNSHMTLSDFKGIYFWEYFHRLFGRLIGVVFFLPYVFLICTSSMSRGWHLKLVLAFVLGGLQGLLGWYMVKSGLVDRPDVSHFRLAAHFGLALVILSYLYWLILEIRHPIRKIRKQIKLKSPLINFSILVIFQIILGAFVAGLDAGLTHNTFPKMGRHWIAPEVFNALSLGFGALDNVVFVQFMHRLVGVLLLMVGLYLWFKSKKLKPFMQKRSLQLMLAVLVIQFLLGVFTLINFVPVSLAVGHQTCAAVFLLLLVRTWFHSIYKIKI